jgi:hypothetical protein
MENKNKLAAPDNDKIDVNENNEVEYWTARFDISKVQLKAAVNAVGKESNEVEIYLKKKYPLH